MVGIPLVVSSRRLARLGPAWSGRQHNTAPNKEHDCKYVYVGLSVPFLWSFWSIYNLIVIGVREWEFRF